MTQEVVQTHGWITTPQMIDALGLAETTPGPLILVTQFVGHLAGAAEGGTALAVLAGALTLWVTFVPCFVWIFAGRASHRLAGRAAAYRDRIARDNRRRRRRDCESVGLVRGQRGLCLR